MAWVRAHGRVLDVLLAAGVTCLAQLEVWTIEDPGTRRIWLAVVALVMTVPLAWRRQVPLATAVAVNAALTISAFAWELPDQTIFPTIALVIATYSVAAWCGRAAAVVGGALALVPVVSHQLARQNDYADAVFIVAMLLAVWVAGRLVRRHRRQAADVADHAAVVEREAEARQQAAVAEERLRIARELHDVVAHSVSMITVQAGAERRVLDDGNPSTKETLESIERTGRQAMAEMRRLLGVLRTTDDEALAPQPSVRHLDVLIDEARAAGVPVEYRLEGDAMTLSPGVDLAAYRIVQEALTNIIKHAGPASATVTIRYGKSQLELEVADTGGGATGAANDGHGLIGMQERVALYGGQLRTENRSPHGYVVHARLPIESHQ